MNVEEKNKIILEASIELWGINILQPFINEELAKIQMKNNNYFSLLELFLLQISFQLDNLIPHLESLRDDQKMKDYYLLHFNRSYNDWIYFQSMSLNPIQRFFVSQLHAVTENSILNYIDIKKIKYNLNDLKKSLKDKYPNISEISLHAYKALEYSSFDHNEINRWINFLDGLTVFRNRGSHSNKDLSETDIKKLELADLHKYLSKNNKVALQIGNYRNLIEEVIVLFSKLFKGQFVV